MRQFAHISLSKFLFSYNLEPEFIQHFSLKIAVLANSL